MSDPEREMNRLTRALSRHADVIGYSVWEWLCAVEYETEQWSRDADGRARRLWHAMPNREKFIDVATAAIRGGVGEQFVAKVDYEPQDQLAEWVAAAGGEAVRGAWGKSWLRPGIGGIRSGLLAGRAYIVDDTTRLLWVEPDATELVTVARAVNGWSVSAPSELSEGARDVFVAEDCGEGLQAEAGSLMLALGSAYPLHRQHFGLRTDALTRGEEGDE